MLPHRSPDAPGAELRLAPEPETSLCIENATSLVESAVGLLEQRPAGLVVELGDVEQIDSSGLKALLHIRRACDSVGVAFRLGSFSGIVDRTVTMSKLNRALGVPDLSRGRPSGGAVVELDLAAPGWRTAEYSALSNPSVVSSLRDKATRAAIEAGARGETLCDIQIAVGEALTNAYKHGSPQKGTSQIRLRCMSCPAAIVIEVQDEGPSFDPNCLPIPDAHEMRDHGMGIYVIREAMDIVEFECDCPGNRVRMVKWLRDGD